MIDLAVYLRDGRHVTFGGYAASLWMAAERLAEDTMLTSLYLVQPDGIEERVEIDDIVSIELLTRVAVSPAPHPTEAEVE